MSDFRDVVIEGIMRCYSFCGVPAPLSSDEVRQMIYLVGEQSYLAAAGLNGIPHREVPLSQLFYSFREGQAARALKEALRLWGAPTSMNMTLQAVADMERDLNRAWSPAWAGMALRAVPLVAIAPLRSEGAGIARLLGTGTSTGALPLLGCYVDSFSRGDIQMLHAIDSAVAEDALLGPLALELAACFMGGLGERGKLLPKSEEESLIMCLSFMLSESLSSFGQGG
ncbi:MAG: hypothetical protein HY683_01425 [Chloroflexi bacterium]|nr:hypothetical protein [Chloroflexota bacterium]